MDELIWGRQDIVPGDARGTWGTRLKVLRKAHGWGVQTDSQHESFEGDADILQHLAGDTPLNEILAIVSDLVNDGLLAPTEPDCHVVLIQKGPVVVVASTGDDARHLTLTGWCI
jgi:hypothetical protein